MHIMTGNLSHQIEHHLFPDLPSNRYAEIAPRVREICSRYGLSYTSGSLPRQVGSAWKRVIKLSLPNDFSIHDTAKRVLRRGRRAKAGSGGREVAESGSI
jgi:NADPH-dependent stearoyl-CoA 9-desaturase